jgi:hypothetical protein
VSGTFLKVTIYDKYLDRINVIIFHHKDTKVTKKEVPKVLKVPRVPKVPEVTLLFLNFSSL